MMPRRQDATPPRETELWNVEAEAALLGAMMIDNRLIDHVADIVSAADFYEQLHGRIFDTIMRMVARDLVANPVTMRPMFEGDETMRELGGPGYLAGLTDSGAALIGFRDFAEQIADLAARRRLVDALERVKQRITNPDLTIAALVDEADAALVASIEKREVTPQISIGDGMKAALQRIEAAQRDDTPLGVTSGVCDIDQLLGTLRPRLLTIIAGRPGMGKTSVAVSTALGAARSGAGVLFISLEMGEEELSQRALADLSFKQTRGIEFSKITDARLSGDEMRELARTAADYENLPLMIVDPGSMTIARLALGVRRHKRRFEARGTPLKLVIVDYLQLLHADGKFQNRNEEVAEVSRALKQIAKDNDVHVIALSQLNRGVEGREDKRPGLADLRESGQIEQDADAIMFLYREEYYLDKAKPRRGDKQEKFDAWEQAKSAVAGRIEFILAKRRNGAAGITKTGYFLAHYQAVRGSDHYSEDKGPPLL